MNPLIEQLGDHNYGEVAEIVHTRGSPGVDSERMDSTGLAPTTGHDDEESDSEPQGVDTAGPGEDDEFLLSPSDEEPNDPNKTHHSDGDGSESSAGETITRIIASIPYTAITCTLCQITFEHPKRLEEHMRGHPDISFAFHCRKCPTYKNAYYHRATIHHGKCTGPKEVANRRATPWQCEVCEYSCSTKAGLGQHERHRHPVLRNQNRIKTREAERVKKASKRREREGFRPDKIWRAEEVTELKRLNEKHWEKRFINIAIASELRTKTKEQIAEKRRYLDLIHNCRIPEADPDSQDPEMANLGEETSHSEVTEEGNGSLGDIDPETVMTGVDREGDETDPPEEQDETDASTQDQELIAELAKTTLGHKVLGVMLQTRENPQSQECRDASEELMDTILREWEGQPKNQNLRRESTKKGKKKGKKGRKAARLIPKIQAYRRAQQLYGTNRKRLAAEVLDQAPSGNCPIDPKVVEETYMGRFAKDSPPVDLSSYPKPAGEMDSAMVTDHITIKEVKKAASTMRKDTAKGPDGMALKTILKQDPSGATLTGLFNIWISSAHVPKTVKENRSILLPKKDPASTDIGDWRPLTIASVFLRLYTKVLAARMSQTVPLNPRQRGFIKAPGCAENLTTIRTLIEKGKRENGIAVAFLDLAKAFDTVSHELVFAGLRRFGATEHLVGIVGNLYQDTSTSFKVEQGSTAQIPMRCGVKQGDPLSPMLFNIALDPLFCMLESKGNPHNVDGTKLASLAYADDTAVLSDTRKGLAANLRLVKQFCSDSGLRLNVKKCVAFVIKKLGSRSFTVNECQALEINGERLPWLDPGETYKYLGGQVGNWSGTGSRHIDTLQLWCQRLNKAALKPFQKVAMFKTYVMPRMISKLEVEQKVTAKELHSLDRASRWWVRRWLRLPNDTSNSFMHAGTNDGGLGIPKLFTEVPSRQAATLNACLNSKDHVITMVAALNEYDDKIAVRAKRVGLQLPWPNKAARKVRETQSRNWEKQKVQGKGVACWRKAKYSNVWLNEETFMSTGEQLTALRMRTNTFPTREYTARGGRRHEANCRRCNRTTETLGHILGCCTKVKRRRIARHKLVCTEVTKLAKKRGYTVKETPKVQGSDGKTYYPDMVLIKDQSATIVDPSIVWDDTPGRLERAGREKCRKYKVLQESVKALTGCKGEVKVMPLIIGGRGAWHSCNDPITKLLEAPKGWCKYLCLKVLCKSIRMLWQFMKEEPEP